MLKLRSVIFLSLVGVSVALNPSCAPGGNLDLSPWQLQLPTGNQGDPTTISSGQLEGCSGYEDYSTFFTESGDGALVMKVCGSPSSCGCVTTPNSLHCRTELKENTSWQPTAPTNKLLVTLAVPTPDDSEHGTVVGQVHMDSSVSTKPVCELYYSSNGDLNMGVEQTRSGGDEILTYIGNVPVGTTFSYEITYESGQLSVSLNDGPQQVLSQYSLDNPLSYFKAGNYNQVRASPRSTVLAIVFLTWSRAPPHRMCISSLSPFNTDRPCTQSFGKQSPRQRQYLEANFVSTPSEQERSAVCRCEEETKVG